MRTMIFEEDKILAIEDIDDSQFFVQKHGFRLLFEAKVETITSFEIRNFILRIKEKYFQEEFK